MITHPDKVLFPDDGITKGDLAAYYEALSPVILPHLRGRPITMERYPAGIGAKALATFDVSLEAVRSEVEHRVGTSDSASPGQLSFSPRAKQVFEFALREAKGLDHDYLGTEHLTLGLLRVTDGVAAGILSDCYGLDRDGVLYRVVELLPDTGFRSRGRRTRPFLRRPVEWHMPENAVAQSRRRRLVQDLEAVLDENERLRKLLRDRGIDPDERPGEQPA